MEMIDESTVLTMQRDQYSHDKRNHFDILSRHKIDRLKHYALHFAKYAGRLAAGENKCGKTVVETGVDSLLVSISAANTIPVRLESPKALPDLNRSELLKAYTLSMGRFCDGVEKIDHAEFDDVRRILCTSNQELFELGLFILGSAEVDPLSALQIRRQFLKERAFFVEGN